MIQTVCTRKSHAKINLFLYVTGRLDNGYHTLKTLMAPIELHDDITLDFSSQDICVTCAHPDVPEDDSNLVVKAAKTYFNALASKGIEYGSGLSIHIEKRIPPGGGLGGGSSNAAVVLNALNDRYHQVLSHQELIDMGVSLGADIPFFINGRPCLATGVGEQLEPLENLPVYHLVLCDPGVAASTVKVYKNIDFRLTHGQKESINTGLNVLSLGQGLNLRDYLHNDLEESACRLYPQIEATKKKMTEQLGRDVYMTGSGSTLFSLFKTSENARKGVELLSKTWRGKRARFFLTSIKQAD